MTIQCWFVVAVCCCWSGFAQAAPTPSSTQIQWDTYPALPNKVGVAGAFSGVHNDVLIVAGGANFSQGFPWEKTDTGATPPKLYLKDIHVLVKGDDKASWVTSAGLLNEAVAYGVSISTKKGVICIGGERKDDPVENTQAYHLLSSVFTMQWDAANNKIIIDDSLPDLPFGLASAAGAQIGETIYIAGGATTDGPSKTFLALDLGAAVPVWDVLPAWPGPARILPVAAAQTDGADKDFYLFSGRLPGADFTADYLSDAYVYRVGRKTWETLSPITLDGKMRCIMAGTATAMGAHSIGVFGSADGIQMEEILKTLRAGGSVDHLQQSHSGFNREVLTYNTVLDRWSRLNDFPDMPMVTSTAVLWGNDIVIPSGEISPGVRSPTVWRGTLVQKRSFGTLNYIALTVYLVAILINGMWFSRRMKTTNDFFKAGQRIPWWAAGLSIFGTQLSAITFIAIPAACYESDWRRFVAQLTIIAAAPLVVFIFLPFYRRLDITTAYEYLEQRFNVVARTLGSVMFIILQFGRIGIVLFLPSVALAVVTGMSIELCIILMGVLCILYTSMGGMEAVIWTDVVQVVVLMGGAILAIFLMPGIAGASYNEMINVAESAGKFRSVDMRIDFTQATMLTLLLGGFGANIISYGSDQAVIQRYLTTKDEKAAARSIWTNGLLTLPASLIFFLIGSLLFAFFQMHPTAMDPSLSREGIFPLFVVTQMPAGIAGLIVAAVFAASMSSLDSSMNSVSAAVTTDFYTRFGTEHNPKRALRLAKIVVIVIGLLGTGFALVMAQQPDIRSMWDKFAGYIGLFGGGLGGLFLLAILTRRPSGHAAVLALVLSGGVQAWLKFGAPTLAEPFKLNSWMYGFTGLASCFIFGVVLGFIFPNKKDLRGLTIYTVGQAKVS